jgi:hypothetical protein
MVGCADSGRRGDGAFEVGLSNVLQSPSQNHGSVLDFDTASRDVWRDWFGGVSPLNSAQVRVLRARTIRLG